MQIFWCGCIGHIDGYDHTYWKYKGYLGFYRFNNVAGNASACNKANRAVSKLQRQLVVAKIAPELEAIDTTTYAVEVDQEKHLMRMYKSRLERTYRQGQSIYIRC